MITSKTKLIIFSIVASLFIFNNTALATPVDDALIEQDMVLHDITMQQQELDKLSNEYNEALAEKDKIKNNIQKLETKILNTEKELQHNQLALEAQCINKYKYGDMSAINVLVDANTFQDFATNLDYYDKIIAQTDEIINKKNSLKQDLTLQKEELALQQKELEKEIQKINIAKEEAEACIKQLENEYSQLNEEIAALLLQQQMTPIFFEIAEANDYIVSNSIFESNSLSETIAQSEEFAAYLEERGASANDIVERAYSMIGSPYVWGGTTSDGFDCSGFVSYCLSGEEGTRLGTTGTFIEWNQVSDPQPGDVCVVHNGSSQHTGVYVGDGKMVHASTYGVGVVESEVQEGMIYVRYE